MVERPIKKSERQAKVNSEANSENLDSTLPVEPNPEIPKPNTEIPKPTINRSSDKGKKASFKDERKQQVNQHGNPALARGPKPVQPKVNVQTEPESEPETESEPSSEESQD